MLLNKYNASYKRERVWNHENGLRHFSLAEELLICQAKFSDI